MKGNADVVILTHYSTLESSPDHERRVSRVPTGETICVILRSTQYHCAKGGYHVRADTYHPVSPANYIIPERVDCTVRIRNK